MPDISALKSCGSRETGDHPQTPYCSVNYHFGMLLGVGDFETEQSYHRGKMWLHTSWLHREGVVQGFDVRTQPDHGEIRVLPGLAVDALGREIHLDADACLQVAAWFEDRRKKFPDDTGWFIEDAASGTFHFDGHVVVRFKTCLTRQVPALSEPCDSSGASTAYSRRCESVEILFRPRLWTDPFGPGGMHAGKPRPYHRLRLLYGLDAPMRDADGKIVAGDLEVLQASRTAESFRQFAALDEIDLRAPEGEEFPVLLANVHGITLKKTDSAWSLAVDKVDVTVRPVHVATATLQELASGPALTGHAAVVVPGSIAVDEVGKKLTFASNADLAEKSVAAAAFALTAFDPVTGWATVTLDSTALGADRRTVALGFSGGLPAGAELVRLVVHGSGSTPLLALLDATLVPFNRGQDLTYDHRRS